MSAVVAENTAQADSDVIRELTLGELAKEGNLENRVFVVERSNVPFFPHDYYDAIPALEEGICLFYEVKDQDENVSLRDTSVIRGIYDSGRSFNFTRHNAQRLLELRQGSERAKKVIEKLGFQHEVNKFRNWHTNYVGADPEIFAVDANGKLIPAFEFLPSKKKPLRQVGFDSDACYWDGYQAEFSFGPRTCLDQVVGSIRSNLWVMNRALKEKFPGAKLSMKNTFKIPLDRLENDPEKYVTFGCSPSQNAYTGLVEPLQDDPRQVPFRTAGGHMHFSYKASPEGIVLAVKELDRILGVISVPLFQYFDTPERRQLYGKAGEYRTPEYGFEYRVLSNAWLCHPTATYLVYEIARVINGYTFTHQKPWAKWDVTEEEARTCIDNCDVSMALELLSRNDHALSILLAATKPLFAKMNLPDAQNAPAVWKQMIRTGIHNYLSNPDFVSDHWGLDADFDWHDYERPHALGIQSPGGWRMRAQMHKKELVSLET